MVLTFGLLLFFVAAFLAVFAFSPFARDERPTLRFQDLGVEPSHLKKKEKKAKGSGFFRAISSVVRPLISPEMRRRFTGNLAVAQSNISPEEFLFFKIVLIVALLIIMPGFFSADMMLFATLMAIVLGYMLPEFWLKSKIGSIKGQIVKQLPDTVDLLGLCVNAGLDFMMALKWVVEKSVPNVVVDEMNKVLQEISVGKPRRDALRDLARKYELPDLSTFSRTLIQADKMGTSVSEALNILSEDMRLARFRRGEAMALKAPLKMLVPLLFCIFPVVGILVGGPIFLDFMMNNPLQNLAG